jgi:hypothetical protein
MYFLVYPDSLISPSQPTLLLRLQMCLQNSFITGYNPSRLLPSY